MKRVSVLTTNDLVQATKELANKLPRHFKAIVGMPSGMVSASLLAAQLNVPCVPVEQARYQAGPLLLVDAIAWNADELLETVKQLPAGTLPAAVYATTAARNRIPYCNQSVMDPAQGIVLPEWGWHSSPHLSSIMLEMDRIICPESPVSVFADAAAYNKHITDAVPLLCVDTPLAGIATSRFEAHRDTTLQWLAKQDIQYEMFACHPGFPRGKDIRNPAQLKAEAFENLDRAAVFLEPNHQIAQRIRDITGKSVVCTHCWTLMQPTAN